MFELADLRIFVRIADLGNLSRAAKALGAPKSSVSRALARLEAATGSTLVERSYRHLRLTDAGNLFYPHARRILDDVEDARIAITDYAGAPSGLLRLNAPSSFSRHIIAPMLPEFLTRHPGVSVDLIIADEQRDMLAEGFDLTIRIGPLADSTLIARRLRTTELWACASPDYLAARGAPRDGTEPVGHDLVGRADKMLEWLAGAGQRDPSMSLDQWTVRTTASDVVEIVLIAGGGIGMLPDYVAQPAIAQGRLVRVFADVEPFAVEVHALYPDHRSLSAKVRVFIDALASHLNERIATA